VLLDIVLLEALLDGADDDVVRHKLAALHEGLGFLAELGAGRDGRTEHVAGGEVHDPELLPNILALRALAAGGGARDDDAEGLLAAHALPREHHTRATLGFCGSGHLLLRLVRDVQHLLDVFPDVLFGPLAVHLVGHFSVELLDGGDVVVEALETHLDLLLSVIRALDDAILQLWRRRVEVNMV